MADRRQCPVGPSPEPGRVDTTRNSLPVVPMASPTSVAAGCVGDDGLTVKDVDVLPPPECDHVTTRL